MSAWEKNTGAIFSHTVGHAQQIRTSESHNPEAILLTRIRYPSFKKRSLYLHSGGVLRTGWAKLTGWICLGLKAFGVQQEGCIPALFWQTGCNNTSFSTGTQMGKFAGLSGMSRDRKKWNGARFERIFPHFSDPHISCITERGWTRKGDHSWLSDHVKNSILAIV